MNRKDEAGAGGSLGPVFRVFVDTSEESAMLEDELKREGQHFASIPVRSAEEQLRRGLWQLPAIDTGYETFHGMTEIRAYLGLGLPARKA